MNKKHFSTSPQCKICASHVQMNYSKQQWRIYCSANCAKLDKGSQLEKAKHTNLEKYGTENVFQNADIRQKQRNTMMIKYGVPYSGLSTELSTLRQQTCLEKYGVDNPAKSGIIQEKCKQTNMERYGGERPACSPITQEKIKQTNLERYGVEYFPFRQESCNTMIMKYGVSYSGASPMLHDKMKQTCLEKYGVDNPRKASKVKEAIKQTNLKKYGHASYLISPDGQRLSKQTCLEKYGVEHPTQNNKVQEKRKSTTMQKYGVRNYVQQHMVDIFHFIHDYDWMVDQYITKQKTATQIATELGCLDAHIVCNYLRQHEIEIRYNFNYSCKCIMWLDSIIDTQSIHVQHALNGGEYSIPETHYKADGYCEATNTIYEFHGDYWHGNPDVYAPDIFNDTCQKYMGELYQTTLRKEQTILELGYNLVVMWECDFDALNFTQQ